MKHQEQQYLDLLQDILENGEERSDRTGTGTLSLFGRQMRFDLGTEFPAITTKKLAWKAMSSELLWFLEGSGDERRLREILHGDRNSPKPTIWTANGEADYWKSKAKFEGDLGLVYGTQWRAFRSIDEVFGVHNGQDCGTIKYVDQVSELLDGLKKDPFGRRHIINAWHPGEFDKMALPPCHVMAQFYVSKMTDTDIVNYLRSKVELSGIGNESEDYNADKVVPEYKLSCSMYQRSCDVPLGVPFNIASYSLLTYMVAQVCGFHVGEFIWMGGDCHIYLDQLDGVKEQLTRTPYGLPQLWLNPEVNDLFSFKMDDMKLENYEHHDPIVMKMAV
jgi:thymidylate synthase